MGADIRTESDSIVPEAYTNKLLRQNLFEIEEKRSCAAVLTLKSAITAESFVKLTVHMLCSGDMPRFTRVWVSVNGGPKRAAYASGQKGRLGGGYFGLEDLTDDIMELELPVKSAELIAGDNIIEFTSDPQGDGKLLLCGNNLGTQPKLSLTVYTPSFEDEIFARVPASWETYEPDASGRGQFVDYDGVGWYRRRILLGADSYSYNALCFGGVDYYCEAWYNGIFLGSHEGGYDEFSFDIEPLIPDCERSGELVLRVTDQTFDINGRFFIKETPAGFLQDSIGMNYAGIWQPAALRSITNVAVCDLFPLPDVDRGIAELRVKLKSTSPEPCTISLYAEVKGDGAKRKSDPAIITVGALDSAEVTLIVDMNGCKLWDTSSPFLYTATVTVQSEGENLTGASSCFGMRSLCVSGTEVLFNGERLVLTGVLDWLFNFDIFSPAVDRERFRADLAKIREAGFNAVKYCLVVPPEYMLDIHDEMGIFAYVEYPMWQERETTALFCGLMTSCLGLYVRTAPIQAL